MMIREIIKRIIIKILLTAFIDPVVVNRLVLHHAESIILLRNIQMSIISKVISTHTYIMVTLAF